MINFDDLVLKSGSHKSPEESMCVMEAVAYFNDEPHSDKPQCACPVLTKYMIHLNDNLKEGERQLRIVGLEDHAIALEQVKYADWQTGKKAADAATYATYAATDAKQRQKIIDMAFKALNRALEV